MAPWAQVRMDCRVPDQFRTCVFSTAGCCKTRILPGRLSQVIPQDPCMCKQEERANRSAPGSRT